MPPSPPVPTMSPKPHQERTLSPTHSPIPKPPPTIPDQLIADVTPSQKATHLCPHLIAPKEEEG